MERNCNWWGNFRSKKQWKLFKIQVKTCTLKEDAFLEFATSTSHTNTQGTKNINYLKEEVDFFATYYEGQCYLVPFEKCGNCARRFRLRLVPTKNGQIKGVNFAKDFLLQDIIQNISDWLKNHGVAGSSPAWRNNTDKVW